MKKRFVLFSIITLTLAGCKSGDTTSLSKERVTKALYQVKLKERFPQKEYKDYSFQEVCRTNESEDTYIVRFSYEFDGEKFEHKEAIFLNEETQKFELKQVNAYEASGECLK